MLRSKYKYQVRILTINILRLLGASSAALAHYRIFGVKNVQYDTLSHLVMARGATFAIESGKDIGVFEEALATSLWCTSGQREAREMVVKAFNYNALSKVRPHRSFVASPQADRLFGNARSRTSPNSATASPTRSRTVSQPLRRSACAFCEACSTLPPRKKRCRRSSG